MIEPESAAYKAIVLTLTYTISLFPVHLKMMLFGFVVIATEFSEFFIYFGYMVVKVWKEVEVNQWKS